MSIPRYGNKQLAANAFLAFEGDAAGQRARFPFQTANASPSESSQSTWQTVQDVLFRFRPWITPQEGGRRTRASDQSPTEYLAEALQRLTRSDPCLAYHVPPPEDEYTGFTNEAIMSDHFIIHFLDPLAAILEDILIACKSEYTIRHTGQRTLSVLKMPETDECKPVRPDFILYAILRKDAERIRQSRSLDDYKSVRVINLVVLEGKRPGLLHGQSWIDARELGDDVHSIAMFREHADYHNSVRHIFPQGLNYQKQTQVHHVIIFDFREMVALRFTTKRNVAEVEVQSNIEFSADGRRLTVRQQMLYICLQALWFARTPSGRGIISDEPAM